MFFRVKNGDCRKRQPPLHQRADRSVGTAQAIAVRRKVLQGLAAPTGFVDHGGVFDVRHLVGRRIQTGMTNVGGDVLFCLTTKAAVHDH